MSERIKNCFFIANNNIGDSGLSGGCRIFIELARYWKESIDLRIIATEEAITVCKHHGLQDIKFYKSSSKLGFKNVFTLRAVFTNFFKKLTNGVLFILKNKSLFKKNPWIYSVSDFYPDLIPAFLIKLVNPKVKWIAGYYLFASSPWDKDSPYKGKDCLRGFLYWLSQRLTYWLVKKYADIVFVTSEPDKKKFLTKKRKDTEIFVIRGGVNIEASTEYLNGNNVIPQDKRKYECCFVGRFHQQKGVLALVDIWKKVADKKPLAKLAMIGNGPLESEVKKKLINLGLENNVSLFGFIDGKEKFNIFKQSKIILHPATFDSGGMAAAEAMACGLPGVSFDLEALKTYYPKGMLKTQCFNIQEFANNILNLLKNNDLYLKTSNDALELVKEQWDWDKRANLIYKEIFTNEQ